MFLPDNSVFTPVKDPNMAVERTANARLPMARRLTTFDEVEQTYTEAEALLEAQRCLKCPTPWCTNACPANVPVQDFIAKIRERDYEAAYALIRTASTLPEACSRLCPQEKQCQSNCTRSIRTQAVGIGRLERFVVERHYESGAAARPAAPTGKTVAVVGSGPSGLSAAQALSDAGHAVTVYEAEDRLGGLLRYGVPNMKLEKGVLDRKLAAMQAQGVRFVTGADVTQTKAAELLRDFDAVVLSAGAKNPRGLTLDGAENAQGIYFAVDFLTASTRSLLDAAPSAVSARGKDVVIIGGGDTGNDCVGTCVRQGCRSVTQIEMLPQYTVRQVVRNPLPEKAQEVKFDSSQQEHLTVFSRDPHIYQATVQSVQTDASDSLQRVTIVHLDARRDASGRLNMTPRPGTEETLPCQLLILAAGFLGPKAQVAQAFGVNANARSNIDAPAYQTSAEKVFACGDCRTGQSLVVKAMTDGRACAKAVCAYLSK